MLTNPIKPAKLLIKSVKYIFFGTSFAFLLYKKVMTKNVVQQLNIVLKQLSSKGSTPAYVSGSLLSIPPGFIICLVTML